MHRILLLLFTLALLAAAFACTGQQGTNTTTSYDNDSPTEAYKRLYAAVKSKDTEAIKKQLTKKSIDFGIMAAQRQNSPVEKLYANGFTATTFADSLPTIRDERISENMGQVEVWNSKDSKWEDLPFIFEDGAWKLAVGDLFAGSFKSPGKGTDQREKEAANALNPPTTSSNTNANTKPIIRSKPVNAPPGLNP